MDIDTTRSNPARLYDYLLGGTHNFEADRQAGEHLIKLLPSVRDAMVLQRGFLFDAVQRLAHGGYGFYLDLATGLPTQGYIHELAPNARMLYNDIDPGTVAYAREIIGNNPNIRYIQSNLIEIETILQE